MNTSFKVNVEEVREDLKRNAGEQKELLDLCLREDRKMRKDELKRYNDLQIEEKGIETVLKSARDGGYKPSRVDGNRPNNGGKRWNVGNRDLEGYSLCRAFSKLATFQPLDGLEGEMHQELLRYGMKQPSGNGLLVPMNALVGTRMNDLTATGGGTSGGNLVPTETLGLIDILRNRLAVGQLGATILSNLSGDIEIPRQTGKAALTWKGETAALDESSQTFDQVTMTPRRGGTFTEFSRQLLAQSSEDVENFVRSDIRKAIAEGVDLAALNGSGVSNQPTGILQDADVLEHALGANGAALTYADIVELETLVANNNADTGSLAYLTNTKVRGKLKTTEIVATTGRFIWEGNQLNGYNAIASNQIPSNLTKGTGTDLSAMIFGNWADLLIGSWGPGVELLANPFSRDTEGIVRVTGWVFLDIARRQPKSFARIVDAITA